MLNAGTRLGPYEILSAIGAGGMGEVYKARDTRLDRVVAVKVLPPDLTNTDDARQRFEREARAISQLNHPSICTLYDVGQASFDSVRPESVEGRTFAQDRPRDEQIHFLVMEYLEGETLAARLARGARSASGSGATSVRAPSGTSVSAPASPRPGASRAPGTSARGPLPLDQVFRFAVEMANALDAAHRRGIVHRDLKPGNVMLTKSGVKLLDFGLAKLTNQAPVSGFRDGETRTAAPLTSEGALLGTLQYMAPEQLEGRDVDARGDIFAFGTLLFELLTGRQPFESQSQAGMIAAILNEEPPALADLADVRTPLPPAAHRALERLLRKCLAKDPDDRWQSAADLADELEWINDERLGGAGDEDQAAPMLAPAALLHSRTRERVLMAVAGTLFLALSGVATWIALQPKAARPEPVQFTIAAPDKNPFAGWGMMSLSPDGRRLAFTTTANGKNQLWVRALDSLTPHALPGTDDGFQPFWSPNSRFVAFTTAGKLKRVDVTGGTPLTLADSANGTGSWSASGVILFEGRDRRLYRIPEGGGQPGLVTELDKGRQETAHSWPIFLPDGRRFVFLAQSSDAAKNALYLGSLASPARTHLVDVLSFVAYAQGHLFYQRDGTLMAQPLDEKAGRLVGDAAPVVEGLDYNPANGRAVFSVSANGTLAYRASGTSATRTLTWFDRQGKQSGIVGEPGQYGDLRLTRDGRWLAVSKAESGARQSSQNDIWVIDLERNVPTRLTSDPAHDGSPVWSADGSHVIFSSVRNGADGLYQANAGGGGKDELLFESPENKSAADVSSDGRLLLFRRKGDIWALPLTGDRKPFSVIATNFLDVNPRFSPDVRWVAYQSDESGSWQVYLQPFPTTGSRVRVSTTTGANPAWSADGKQLVYRTLDAHTMGVDVTNPLRPGVPRETFIQGIPGFSYVIDPSAQRLLIPASNDAAAAAPITVVLNWAGTLGKK